MAIIRTFDGQFCINCHIPVEGEAFRVGVLANENGHKVFITFNEPSNASSPVHNALQMLNVVQSMYRGIGAFLHAEVIEKNNAQQPVLVLDCNIQELNGMDSKIHFLEELGKNVAIDITNLLKIYYPEEGTNTPVEPVFESIGFLNHQNLKDIVQEISCSESKGGWVSRVPGPEQVRAAFQR